MSPVESNAGQMLKRVQHDEKEMTRAFGFTMAEILLSLTIIGVVAAITLPSLTGNINERTWNTQRKALYARMSQAISLMPAVSGYGTLTEATSSASAVDTAAETFVTSGLSKVLKINNICDSEHLADCGLPAKITTMGNSVLENGLPTTLVGYNPMFNSTFSFVWSDALVVHSHSQTDTRVAAFETVNGESMAVYYNPFCSADLTSSEMSQAMMCANFIYDLNGSKGPNTVGKDIGFMSVLYATDSVVVAPLPTLQNSSDGLKQKEGGPYCQGIDGYRMPNREEAFALFYNKSLLKDFSGNMWTSTLISSSDAYALNTESGKCLPVGRETQYRIHCVQR